MRLHRPLVAVLVLAGLAARAAAGDWALVPDPADPDPLGSRTPLVLIHGYDSRHALLPFDPARDRTWDTLRNRRELVRLRPRLKLYELHYRPWDPLPAIGAGCAEELVRAFFSDAPPERSLLLVGHSAGGLVARYAAADPRLGSRVAGIVTLATPHHGSAMASILFAKPAFKRRIGRIRYGLLARGRQGEPDTPLLASLAVDDYDDALASLPLATWGVRVNPALRAFNASDPNLGRILAYQGRVAAFWIRGKGGFEAEIRRRILAKFHPCFRMADPLVHPASGLFAGGALGGRREFPGVEHGEIVRHPVVLGTLFEDLASLLRSAAARALYARAGLSD